MINHDRFPCGTARRSIDSYQPMQFSDRSPKLWIAAHLARATWGVFVWTRQDHVRLGRCNQSKSTTKPKGNPLFSVDVPCLSTVAGNGSLTVMLTLSDGGALTRTRRSWSCSRQASRRSRRGHIFTTAWQSAFPLRCRAPASRSITCGIVM
jgi:hypothetical protein